MKNHKAYGINMTILKRISFNFQFCCIQKPIVSILLLSIFSLGSAQENNSKHYSNHEIEAKVDSVMATMSMEDKLAQITGPRLKEIMVDYEFSIEKCREVIPNGIGHFCQFSSGLIKSPEELRDLVRKIQHYLITETTNKIPAIFHEEAITDFATQGATTFPQQIGVGCSWNPEIVKKNARSTAQNMRAAGATFALSPMLDLSRSAHWNRIEESYGEDAYFTSRMGVAFANGLQGDDFKSGVAATVKHFAGYGTSNNNIKELYEEYLMPHEAAIKIADAKSVMPSYGKYKALAVTANPIMLDQILRQEIGFDGLVVSDYGAVNLIRKGHQQVENSVMATAMVINTGVDIELSSPVAYPPLPQAIKQGLVSEETINQSVKRSLLMKAKLGLLYRHPVIGKDGALDFDPPAYRNLAYETAKQSIVLLKNDGLLPLKKDIQNISLVGPNVATVHCLLGDYTYQSMILFWHGKEFDPTNPRLVTLKKGMENKLRKRVKIKHERGCDWSSPLETKIYTGSLGDDRLSKLRLLTIKDLSQPDLQNALKISEESDVIIAGMGENLYLCGEGRMRKGIRLPGEQEAFVEKLIATGKPVILVVFSGRQQLLSRFEEKCAAIIQAWFPGEESGNALADIIAGNVNPSAKLCVTYLKTESEQEINYKNGYDSNNLPQYPFGFGLSYTTFEYSNLRMEDVADVTGERFSISLDVRNTGKMDGTEIVQWYVSPKDKISTMKPIQLKGFQRVALKAGEKKRV
ncbi:beta-glucosidase [Salegentibacter agarivorans]|uniref:Beta-glucosidase n=1 Tax=Salegentibacter agarivorans TaxID=345907 RepID=A0A1I2KMQ9_9FLAO|nr:glycoside hydrolase family 3 N-terminal domain-containing protein [Salegentibacter agarivorans]SFF68245.1 beta-glucosidase [Salegentibacter agarivorans]